MASSLSRSYTTFLPRSHSTLLPPRHLPASYSSFGRLRTPCLLHSLTFYPPPSSSPRAALQTEAGDSFLPPGVWPDCFSILNFEDLSKHYESVLFKDEAQPSTFLADVMSKAIYTARPDQLLEEVDHFFIDISGLPVVDSDDKCIGVFSIKDKGRALNGLKSRVGDVMSTPPITLSADKTVLDAATLMLKCKVHRIPIVNESNQVVGIVTRTDIFSALEMKT